MRALVGCLTGLLLISALALGTGCLTWPTTAEWVQLDTDPNDCNTVRAHRDVLTGYFAFKGGYLYLRLRTVASPGWPGVLANDQARFKWFIDTNGSDILKQGQIINNAEFLLMTEDRSPLDRLGEVTLMDDLSHIGFTTRWNAMNAGAYFTGIPAAGGPSAHWKRETGAGTAGTGGPQSACGIEIGYRIDDVTTGGFYVDTYVKLSHLPADPLQVFWVSDNLNPNLNQGPTCDTADHGGGFPLRGTLVVQKRVDGVAPGTGWGFSVTGPSTVSPFTLPADGGSKAITDLPGGKYTISETTKAGYTTTSSSNAGDTGTNSITVDVPPGGNRIVTFVNTAQPGTITVKKVVDGVAPGSAWEFAGTGAIGAFTLAAGGGETPFTDLAAGTYTISETPKSGYTTTSSATGGETGADHISVTLPPGGNITVTFTNVAQPGTLVVKKEVNGAPPVDDWQFTGGIGPFTLPAGGGQTSSSVAAGTYTITETTKPGYTPAACSTCGASGHTNGGFHIDAHVSPGATTTITFINTKEGEATGTIVVQKQVVGVAPATVWDFTEDLGIFPLPTTGGSETFAGLAAGAYTITETFKAGYTTTSSSPPSDTGTNAITVTVPSGGNRIVTFVNTAQPGTITVRKELTGVVPGSDWQFAGTGAIGAFTLPAAGGETTFSDLAAGSYTIVETTKDGYEVTADGLPQDHVTVDLPPGETRTVTFTNAAQPATIVLKKAVTGPAPGTDWEFFGTGAIGSLTLPPGGGVQTISDLAAGSYTITETTKAGYTLTLCATCGAVGPNSLTTSVAPGETRTVTLANTQELPGAPPPPTPPPPGGVGGSGVNHAPIPNAGSDQAVCVGERVCLDGSKSFDPDEDIPPIASLSLPIGPQYVHQVREDLRFEWAFAVLYYLNGKPVLGVPSGSAVLDTIEGFDTEYPCFTPDLPGEYVLTLTITDDFGATLTDQVTITAEECSTILTCCYPRGWNLISLSLHPVHPEVETILGETTASPQKAFTYVRGYEPAETLSPLAGHWVHFAAPECVSVRGREATEDVTIELETAGWHLIGVPYAIAWENIKVVIDGVKRQLRESAAQEAIEDVAYCYGLEEEVYRFAQVLLPCKGYWVRTKRDDIALRLEARYALTGFVAGGCGSGEIGSGPPPAPEFSASNATMKVYPNPIRHSAAHFIVEGSAAIEAIRVAVYNLAGQPVWTGEEVGTRLDWNARGANGERLAWGPYIYRVDGLIDGQWRLIEKDLIFLAESN